MPPTSTIPVDLAVEVRRRHELGDFPKQIARELKISRADVLRIIKNKRGMSEMVMDDLIATSFRVEVERRRRQFARDWSEWKPYIAQGFQEWWERWGRFHPPVPSRRKGAA